jgi:WD40 repeat protein
MRTAKLLPVLLVSFLILACGGGSDNKKGPPAEATAIPAGTALAITSTALPGTPTPQPVGGFIKSGSAKVPELQGLVWQRGGNGLIAFSSKDVELVDTQGTQKSLLTVTDPEAISSVSETGAVAVKAAQNTVRVQNARTPGPPKVINPGIAFPQAVLSADGSLLALPEQDKIAAMIWDVEENSKLKELTGFQTAAPVYSVSFSPDGRSVIWLSRARVQIEDLASGALSQSFLHEDFVTGLALSTDRTTLVTAAGMKVTVWDTASGQARQTLMQPGIVFDVALAGDNHTLAIGGQTNTTIIDITNGKTLTTLPGIARDVAFSQDGRQLAVADDQGNVTLYRAG